ncbi:MAG: ion channel, partial [Candidatus Methylomirabilales bacterium]
MTSIGKDSALLAALVTMLVAQPLLAYGGLATRILFDAMYALVLLGVLFIIFGRGWERKLALVLVLPAFALYLAYLVLPDRMRVASEVLFNAFMIAFMGLAIAVILRDIFRKSVIGGNDVLGAISGYLLGGVVWGNLYGVIHLFAPGSFAVQPEIAWQLQERHLRHALFNFFSFATLTSLGYNDITPVTPFANTLTWLEVIFGQFYMAV